jgi:hypothetical protein
MPSRHGPISNDDALESRLEHNDKTHDSQRKSDGGVGGRQIASPNQKYDHIKHKNKDKSTIPTNHKGIKCAYTNTDRLQNKLPEIEIFLQNSDIDVLAA